MRKRLKNATSDLLLAVKCTGMQYGMTSMVYYPVTWRKVMSDSNVSNFCETNRLTITEFFRMCHVWYFGKDVDVYIDVERFKQTGEVPQYAQIYLAKYQ